MVFRSDLAVIGYEQRNRMRVSDQEVLHLSAWKADLGLAGMKAVEGNLRQDLTLRDLVRYSASLDRHFGC